MSPGLLPPPTITPEKTEKKEKHERSEDFGAETRLEDGLNIERPRSALHSGNFTPEECSPPAQDDQDTGLEHRGGVFGDATAPWMAASPPRGFAPFSFGRATADYRREAFNPSGTSSLSSSFSSSFVYKAPTSPLVQSESNEDLDLGLPLDSISIATGSPANPRRHTFNFNFSQSSPVGNATHRSALARRESTFPYQAHQPRRSLNSTPNFSFVSSTPQTPAFIRSRRPSINSEISPLQHASMVGSYEESILRGRMSTTPSKPLEFMAQIGVLGLGKCKPHLRCPAHITLPFSAVFYSYASTSHGRSKIEDGPSPYVGQIDIENGLPNPDEGQRARRKLQVRISERKAAEEEFHMQDVSAELSENEIRRSIRAKRRSKSPKAPPGGRYRIPEKGQLQIIIKNQNKTAVKLFLVPYDLAGMEPGTKTFIRQRSYSAGPIIDNIPQARDAGAEDRPILRYLVHLHICCPSKGRFYLYKSIRVVFANRVPDGKERLRNEITYPDPRFTPYKPVRVMHPHHPAQLSGPGVMLAAEKAFRRRSSGFSYAQFPQPFDQLDGFLPSGQASPDTGRGAAVAGKAPVGALPLGLPCAQSPMDRSTNRAASVTGAAEDGEGWPASITPDRMRGLEMTGFAADTHQLARYDKLSKGDVGYGGNAFALLGAAPGGNPEGLLSKRLKSLGVQRLLDATEQCADQNEELVSG